MSRLYPFLLLLTLAVCAGTVSGQNLVTNPSFEILTGCPTPANWVSCQNSVDYFNACNGSVPNSWAGNQAAASGNGYVAEVNRHATALYHEYYCVALTSPLIIGQTYTCSVSISLTELSTIGANNWGFQFGTGLSATMNNVSQVYSTAVVTDKTSWTVVTGSFVASQAFTHVAIGNFFSDALTATAPAVGGTYTGAYYFFDNVSVVPSPILSNEWKYLDAKARNTEEIELAWEFDLEDYQRYEVLRATDSLSFEEVGEVTQPLGDRFSYVDRPGLYDQPLFYQIRAIDADGNTHTSRIVESRLVDDPNHIRIQPNPAAIGQPMTATFSVEETSTVRIEVLDVIGNKVFEDNFTAQPGRNRYELNTTTLRNGAYLLRMTLGGKTVQTERLVLMK